MNLFRRCRNDEYLDLENGDMSVRTTTKSTIPLKRLNEIKVLTKLFDLVNPFVNKEQNICDQ